VIHGREMRLRGTSSLVLECWALLLYTAHGQHSGPMPSLSALAQPGGGSRWLADPVCDMVRGSGQVRLENVSSRSAACIVERSVAACLLGLHAPLLCDSCLGCLDISPGVSILTTALSGKHGVAVQVSNLRTALSESMGRP
jgi:hypothetical protein